MYNNNNDDRSSNVGTKLYARNQTRARSMMTHLHAGLSSETTEKARLELNENPDTLHQDIQQVHS